MVQNITTAPILRSSSSRPIRIPMPVLLLLSVVVVPIIAKESRSLMSPKRLHLLHPRAIVCRQSRGVERRSPFSQKGSNFLLRDLPAVRLRMMMMVLLRMLHSCAAVEGIHHPTLHPFHFRTRNHHHRCCCCRTSLLFFAATTTTTTTTTPHHHRVRHLSQYRRVIDAIIHIPSYALGRDQKRRQDGTMGRAGKQVRNGREPRSAGVRIDLCCCCCVIGGGGTIEVQEGHGEDELGFVLHVGGGGG